MRQGFIFGFMETASMAGRADMATAAVASAPFFPGFKAHDLTVDGINLHYVTGGSGPPLLLVHGAPQSHIMWRRVAPLLAGHFSLVIPDLRGYGRSGKPARADFSKRRMAADLVAIMDAERHPRFCIAGHDRGARVTRRLAKDHEARVERAAILDIVPTAHVYANMSKSVAINMWNWCIWPAPEPIPETILNPEAIVATFTRSLNIEPEAYRDYIETNGNAEALHSMCEDYRAGASIDLEHDAADANHPIRVPILVIWGARSHSTGTIFDVEAAWRNEASNLRFASLDTGHFMPEEAPEQTAVLLREFFMQ
jgi:haloacetate dehalogenase